MKIFYDTEFLEDGETIALISIGMVAEDGRELYLCNSDAPWKRIHKHDWLVSNVLPGLPRIHGDRRNHVSVRRNPAAVDFHDRRFVKREAIAEQVKVFVQATPDVELWADYCAYDHVVLCQLFGTMMQLPDGFPMWTHDFQQLHEAAGRPELPEQASGLHNALADARHLKAQFDALQGLAERPWKVVPEPPVGSRVHEVGTKHVWTRHTTGWSCWCDEDQAVSWDWESVLADIGRAEYRIEGPA